MQRFILEIAGAVVLAGAGALVLLHWSILTETSPQYLQEARARRGDAGLENGFAVAIVGAQPSNHGFDEGVQLAWEEINASGPLAGKVRLLVFDETSEAVARHTAADVAAHSDVVAVLGHENSANSIRDSITYEKHGILFLATRSTLPVLTTHDFRYTFRLSPDDREIANALVGFAQQRGLLRMGVVHARTAHGQSLAQQFVAVGIEHGLQIVFTRSYHALEESARAQDFRPLAAEVLREGFDAILVVDEPPRAVRLIDDLVRMGVTQPILGSDKMDSAQLWSSAPEASNNIYVASPYAPLADGLARAAFERRFRERFGEGSDYDSSQGYEAFRLLIEAIIRSKTANPLVVATTLRTSSWQGAFGPFSFTLRGDAQGRPLHIKRMRDGVWETVESL